MPDADSSTIAAPADVAWAAFSSDPPWVLPDAQLGWQRPVAAERLAVAADLPELTRRRVLPPGLRIVRTLRHLGLGVGQWYVGARRQGGVASRTDLAHRLRVGAERLGPTYIKLGQIISSGQGLFPPELVDEFALLRDRVPAERFAVIRAVVEAELGRPIEEVFSHFERTPIAAASIAQAHAATLRTGEEVVVKVQRPTVGERVHADLKVMAWIAPFLVGRIPVAALANPPALVDLFAETITEELDFRLEADNMIEVARSYASLGQRGYVIPRPHPTLVTKRVLVMERFRGFAFDDVAGMTDAGIDTEAVVRTGMVGFLEGCMFNGIFHGDLHGGNLLVLPDGRTGLLDFGITGRLPEDQRLAFLRLLVGASMNDVDGQLAALRDLGALPPDADLPAIIIELGLDKPPVDPTTLTAEQLTGEIQRVMKALLGYGARLPKPLMLFVKNLVFLDGAITTLAPDLDLFAEITQIAMYFTTQHGARIAAEVGLAEGGWNLDLSGVKATFGTEAEANGAITHRELRERRQAIADRMEQRPRRRSRFGRRRP
ncbi:AarF/UbiB family protein [soil metagenome]